MHINELSCRVVGSRTGSTSTSQPDELSRVMREIADAMGARGAVLIAYSEDASTRLLHVDGEFGISDEALEAVTSSLRKAARREVLLAPLWLEIAERKIQSDVMCLPVQPVEWHDQLLVVVFFKPLTRSQRDAAEQVYLRRRPFAIGYFRLWQLDQSHRRQIAGLEAALGVLDVGVVLIDRSNRVAFANPTASALLEGQQGIRYQSNRLATTDLRSGIKLQVAIDHVIADGDSTTRSRRAPMLTIERSGDPALIATVVPAAPSSNDPADVAAILYLVDPRMDADRVLRPICRLHGLSPLETRLVCLLASGATLNEAAERMNVKDQTARGSLKQVFIKTGTHRQADLVRLILTSIMRMTPSVTPDVI